jgi:hypothetical protein
MVVVQMGVLVCAEGRKSWACRHMAVLDAMQETQRLLEKMHISMPCETHRAGLHALSAILNSERKQTQ